MYKYCYWSHCSIAEVTYVYPLLQTIFEELLDSYLINKVAYTVSTTDDPRSTSLEDNIIDSESNQDKGGLCSWQNTRQLSESAIFQKYRI